MTSLLQNVVVLAARILLCAIFLISAVGHLFNWGGTVQYMTAHGMAMKEWLGGAGAALVHIWLAGAIAFLLVGGLSVLLGIRARLGAVLLILFLVPTTLIFHNFLTAADDQFQVQVANFLKNAGLGGGLLMVLAFGSGMFSLDLVLPKRRARSAAADRLGGQRQP